MEKSSNINMGINKLKGLTIEYDSNEPKPSYILFNQEVLLDYLINNTDWDGDINNIPEGFELVDNKNITFEDETDKNWWKDE
jgi:hypothetical protein